jgi:hypothetical protein
MVLSLVDILYRNLGIQTVVNEISKKEKFRRKKYRGVLRWVSIRVRMIIARLPIMLRMYVRNKKIKTRTCSSGSSVSPNKMNVVTAV